MASTKDVVSFCKLFVFTMSHTLLYCILNTSLAKAKQQSVKTLGQHYDMNSTGE